MARRTHHQRFAEIGFLKIFDEFRLTHQISDVLHGDRNADFRDGGILGRKDAPIIEDDLVMRHGVVPALVQESTQIGMRNNLLDRFADHHVILPEAKSPARSRVHQ